MAVQNVNLLAFNRGRVSQLALARVDVDRLALSAEEQTNWMPRKLGSMMLRPGFEHLFITRTGARARYIPGVFAIDDTWLAEFTDGAVRIAVNDAILTYPAVTATVANGTFTTD